MAKSRKKCASVFHEQIQCRLAWGHRGPHKAGKRGERWTATWDSDAAAAQDAVQEAIDNLPDCTWCLRHCPD